MFRGDPSRRHGQVARGPFVVLLALLACITLGAGPAAGQPEAAAESPVTLVRAAWAARDRGELPAALEALAAAERLVTPPLGAGGADLAFVLNESSVVLRMVGRLDEALAASQAAAAHLGGNGGSSGGGALGYSVQMNLGLAARELWQGGLAQKAFGQAAQLAIGVGVGEVAQATAELAATELQLGDYETAEAAAVRALDLLSQSQAQSQARAQLVFLRAQGFLARRRPADADAALAGAPAGLPAPLQQERRLLEGRIALQMGEGAVAAATFTALLDETGGQGRIAASALYNLAEERFLAGRYAEAEELNQRAELAWRQVAGPDSPVIAQIHHRLGAILQQVGDAEAALPLYQSALDQIAALLGPDHPLSWATRAEMARSLSQLGRHDEAVALLRTALDSPAAGRAVNDASAILVRAALGLTLKEAGRDAEALEVLRAVREARGRAAFSLPEEPPGLNALAELALAAGDVAGARAAADRSLAILRRLPEGGVDLLGEARRIRADIALAEGDAPLAGRLIDENVAGAARQMTDLAATDARAGDYAPLALRRQIGQALDRGWGQTVATSTPENATTETMFAAAQILHLTEVTRASAGALAAAAERDGALAGLLQERRRVSEDIRALSATQAAGGTLSQQALGRLVALQGERTQLDSRLVALDDPASRLLTPRLVAAEEVQALLGPDEALWLQAMTADHSYLFLVTATGIKVARSDLGQTALTTLVARVRATLDQSRPTGLQPFDIEGSNRLYAGLFAPFEARLSGLRRLILIPDGAAQQISLATLARRVEPMGETVEGADARFLGLTHALVVTPSVSSFAGLRALGPPRPGSGGFTGFGDPALTRPAEGGTTGDGTGGNLRGTPIDRLTGLARAGAIGAIFEPLPETAEELQTLAGTVPPDRRRVFLRAEAAEPVVKALDLSTGGTLAFATHAIVAGEFDNLAEPALVLTPPALPGPEDDGLLTVSEIARLRLAADLVILSACNTGSASGRPGAPGLSGLASGFLSAGARSVVVSHWTILSISSVVIMPSFFRVLAQEGTAEPGPGTPPSEALRRAMVEVSIRPDHAGFAHPAVWGPFAVVGAW